MDGVSTIYLIAVAIVAAGGGFAYLRWSSRQFDQKYGRTAPTAPEHRAATGE